MGSSVVVRTDGAYPAGLLMDDWYYAADNTRYGPITGDLVQQLAVRGVIKPETPMWRSGMAEWQTYLVLCGGKVPTPTPAEAPPAPEPVVETETPREDLSQPRPTVAVTVTAESKPASKFGKSMPKAATFEYGELKLKEADKDLYVQGLLEGKDSVGKDWVLAGFWLRFAASIIDSLLFTIAMAGAMFLMALLARPLAALGILAPFVIIVLQLALFYWYWIWPLANSRQATHGKRMLGMRIIRADGSDLKLGTAIGRLFAYYPSSALLFLGYICVGFDREKRALHDMMCNTRVIRT